MEASYPLALLRQIEENTDGDTVSDSVSTVCLCALPSSRDVSKPVLLTYIGAHSYSCGTRRFDRGC